MPDAIKTETFISTATIYKPGGGHPFPPGTPVELHPLHAADFRAAGLEKKPEEKKPDAPVLSQGKATAKAE